MPTTVYNQREADKFTTGKHVDLVVVECTCGLLFAIPENLNESALKHCGPRGWQISCPLGHTWHYREGQSEADKLRERLARERDHAGRLAADLAQTKSKLTGQKIRASRFKNDRDRERARAHAGVCPVDGCRRHFVDLGRHMASKHPDYTKPEPESETA